VDIRPTPKTDALVYWCVLPAAISHLFIYSFIWGIGTLYQVLASMDYKLPQMCGQCDVTIFYRATLC